MARIDYDGILTIYKDLSMDLSASEIATKMNISPSTLYRLIESNIEVKMNTKEYLMCYRYHDCIHLSECKKTVKQCPNICERFQKNLCPKLKKFPFICDFCEARPVCKRERHFWNPVDVYLNREKRLKETRSHLMISKRSLSIFDEWLTPLVKKQLSIEAIHSKYPEAFPVSTSTVRRWIDQSYLMARRIDLRHAVCFRINKRYLYHRPSNRDPLAKFGHTYPYFLEFIKQHPQTSIIEMDTVYGLMSEERKLLTFYHRQSHLQFGILIPNLYASSVNRELMHLQKRLDQQYSKLFEVILADNGLEFDDLIKASTSQDTGEIFSNVFYTRPYNSGDKGGCERNHELFRYLVPKGHRLSDFTQEDINFMFSMINSYPRESLKWKTPIDVFKTFFSKDILDVLAIKEVPLNEINLKR